MRWIGMLAFSLIGLSAANAYLHEGDLSGLLRHAAKEWHAKCQVITGVSDEEIFGLRSGNFAVAENTKRYHLCIFIMANAITPKMEFVERIFRKYIPDNTMVRNYKQCFHESKRTQTQPEEIILGMLHCMFARDPVKFLIV
ncbi:uncharacterized protein [Leptinotarsa decemlineata]|uniref:uncharacterized protein n=1 Tax=Leptinotarsa decemlineata TaxID=7539 RepID=UPI003D30A910